MAFGNAFSLLDDYDDVNAHALIEKVAAAKTAAAAAAEKAAAEAKAEAEKEKEQKQVAGRGRGGYGRGFNGRGRGGGRRGRGFYSNDYGWFANNGNGTGFNGDIQGRGYNGRRGRGGYGNGVFRDGNGQRFDRPYDEGLKRTDSKDSGADCKDENINNGNGNAASGREIPTTNELVAKDVQSEKENADRMVSKDSPSNNESTTVDKEEEKRKKWEKEQEEEKRKRREQERAEDAKKMTLTQYYSKVVVEKKKALEPFLKVEERKVIVDEEFEGMQLIGKKEEEEIFVKLGSEKEKLLKKHKPEKEEKHPKALSLDEFLKPAEGQRYRPVRNNSRGTSADGQDGGANRYGRGLADSTGRNPQVEDGSRPPVRGSAADRGVQYPRGRGRGRGFGGSTVQDPIRTEDPRQFPELGKASKVEAVKA